MWPFHQFLLFFLLRITTIPIERPLRTIQRTLRLSIVRILKIPRSHHHHSHTKHLHKALEFVSQRGRLTHPASIQEPQVQIFQSENTLSYSLGCLNQLEGVRHTQLNFNVGLQGLSSNLDQFQCNFLAAIGHHDV